MQDFSDLRRAIEDLDEDAVKEILTGLVEAGGEGAQEAVAVCQQGLNTIGERFETGEYFVADLIFAGEIMTEAVEILRPALAAESGGPPKGRILLCTVKGDLHDIGKNIVKAIFEAASFEVLDLGIDVSPEAIFETAQKEGIGIIALSGVLTLALDSMKDTVDIFGRNNMRDKVKILIGGAPVNEQAREFTGADAWAHNPHKAIGICTAWAQA